MATNFLTLRNTQQYNTGGSTITDGSISITSTNKQWWTNTLGQTLSYSTLTGSTISAQSIAGSSINFTSNALALGPSTTATPGANLSNGTWSTWATAKNSMTNVRKVASSSTGQYRLILIGVAGTSALWLSSDSGVTWSQCTAYGLPAGSAYDYRCGSISADGAYITIGVYGDTLYTSTDSGATFNNPAPGSTPYSWLRFENSFTDLGSGGATITPTTGGNAPTFSSTVVPQSGSAYSMRLTNTAGGTASQYVRGTWAGAANFTVSFWMNPQSFSASNNIQVFSAYAGVVDIFITQSTNLLTFYIPTGGSTGAINVGYTTALSTNTWYYVTGIFQTNGLCSFYVNNSLIGTYVNSGGFGSFGSTGSYGLGCQDNATVQAFNGFIDDFRLYNTAITYQNVRLAPYAWLKFENSVADAMGAITPTVTGSVTYVPGVVGNSAVVLANTAGGTANQYVRGTLSGFSSAISISVWFQLLSYSSNAQVIFSTGGNNITIYLNQSTHSTPNSLGFNVLNSPAVTTSYGLALNTWYHVVCIAQGSGICYMYLNGQQIGTYSNGSALSSITAFGLGTYEALITYAFNGYIDDFRIYNAAVFPPNASTNQLMTLNHNWSQIALSGSGQYQLAATDYGYLYKSADYGATWSASVGATGGSSTGCVKNLTMSHSGQYMLANAQAWVTPNMLTASTSPPWTQNGVFWSASASTTASTYSVYGPFDTVSAGTPANSWNSANTYNLSGAYTGAVSTTVLGGVGAVTGEYLQLQSSMPLVLSSYSIRAGGYWQFMKTGYLVGSTDGVSWYPLQNISYAANPYTVNYATTVGTIQVNYTGTQSVTANTTVSATTTAYSTSTTPYTYFRLIAQTIFSGLNSADCISINEFYPNFLAANTYTPLQASGSGGPTAWTVNGVTYTSSQSSSDGSLALQLFLYSGAAFWRTSTASYTGSAYSAGTYLTVIQNVGTIGGEYAQIQTSIPMVMSSYVLRANTGASSPNQVAKTYYIVGSNDGSTWYPLQYVNFTTNPFTGASTTSPIVVNYTGTQTITASTVGSATTTSYSTTTQSFTYFRMIVTNIYTPETQLKIGGWWINFLGGQTYSTNYGSTWSVVPTTYLAGPTAISGSGQYQIGVNNTPLLARLTLDGSAVDSMGGLTAATGAGTVTYSTSIKQVGTHSALFSNPSVTPPNTYLSYTLPSVLTPPSVLSVSLWAYAQTTGDGSRGPFGIGLSSQYAVTMYLNSASYYTLSFFSSNLPTTVRDVSSSGTVALNTWYHLVCTFDGSTARFYLNGVLQGSLTYTGSLCAYNNIVPTNLYVGSIQANTYAFNGYVDDVRLYTSALTAAQVAALYADATSTFQSLAVTSNYLAGLTSSPSAPVSLTGSTLIDTATSYTGQYMIVVTAATSGSNVYYSTNYGSSWTGLSVGLASAPLVSCAMSYDGSYATVASSSVVYTLNNNGTGFTLALGTQAGAVAQGANSIAIGNKAGIVNQAASSIVMNATGSTLAACGPGFYVAPIQAANAAATASASGYVNLLGYGDDRQVVQGSSVGINQATGGLRIVYGSALNTNVMVTSDNALCVDRSDGGWNPGDLGAMVMFRQLWYNGYTGPSNVIATGGISGIKTYNNGSFGGGLAFHYQAPGQNNLSQGMTLNSSGYFGIGTAVASFPLDVYGTARIGNGSSYLINLGTSGVGTTRSGIIYGDGTDMGISNQQGGAMILATNNAERMRITNVGSVGIGITNPLYQLDLSGDARKASGTAWVTGSDLRLKNNIHVADTSRCVEIIKTLPLKRYTWRDDLERYQHVTDRSKLGWIAQDVETVFPKAVDKAPFTYNQVYEEVDIVQEDGSVKKEKKLVSEEVIEDCRTLDADQIYAVMYGALQKVIENADEHHAAINTLTATINALQAQVSTLVGTQAPSQP